MVDPSPVIHEHLGIKFESVFKISHILMLINGAHPFLKRNLRWKAHFALAMGTIWILSSAVFYSIMLSIKKSDLTEACRHATLGIVPFVITFKYFILLKYQADTKEMIRSMERDYVQARALTPKEQGIVRYYAERGVWVSKLWLLVGIATSSLFPLQAMFLMLYSAVNGQFRMVMVFEAVLPFYDDRKYDTVFFIILAILSTFYALYAATVYMSFDPLVPIFMLHHCGQLELVKVQIGRLFHKDEQLNDVEIKNRIVRIIERLNDIYRRAGKMESNFVIVYEMVLKVTTICLPLTSYIIIELMKENKISLEFISFAIGALVHFYVPCYYSDLLMEKSLSIADAVYSCNWESQWVDAGTRRTLAVMMIRAQRPLALNTAFNVICLDSFADMCRQAYAIFNLMNASVE